MGERTKDELLLERAEQGDQDAFRELYERHRQPIYRFAYRLLGSIETAEDITHDCFLSLIRDPVRFKQDRASLRTYLFAAARNLAFKKFRDSGNDLTLNDVEEPRSAEKQGPLQKVLDHELATQVRAAVSNLPPLQREALILFTYEGLSLVEIAQVTGSDAGTIKGRLFRGREKLKAVLRPYLVGIPN